MADSKLSLMEILGRDDPIEKGKGLQDFIGQLKRDVDASIEPLTSTESSSQSERDIRVFGKHEDNVKDLSEQLEKEYERIIEKISTAEGNFLRSERLKDHEKSFVRFLEREGSILLRSGDVPEDLKNSMRGKLANIQKLIEEKSIDAT